MKIRNIVVWLSGISLCLSVLTGPVFGVQAGDEVEIQKQIDALGKAGGVVNLKAKVYTIRKTIILKDNITIQGAGRDKTIIRMAEGAAAKSPLKTRVWRGGAACDKPPKNAAAVTPIEGEFLTQEQYWTLPRVFFNEKPNELKTPEGNHDITIRDLTIDGNAESNPYVGEGITIHNSYNIRIENVRVTGCRGFGGINLHPQHAVMKRKEPFRTVILNCLIENQRFAKDRKFTPTDQSVYGMGIYLTAWDLENTLIKGCVVRNCEGTGIHSEDFPQRLFIEENESYNNGGSGIWLCETANSSIKHNKVHHNKQHGIVLSQAHGNHSNLIYGNDVYNNAKCGIYINREYKPGDSLMLIIGNTVRNNNQERIGNNPPLPTQTGIVIDASAGKNVVAHNFVVDDQVEKTQVLSAVIRSTGNYIFNNYFDPGAHSPSIAEGNIYIPWDYNKPWTPENLVSSY